MSTRHQDGSPAFAQDAVLDPTLHTGFAGQPGNGKALVRSVAELAASGDREGRSVSEAQEKAVIRTPDRRLRVFVSSSLDELADERRSRGPSRRCGSPPGDVRAGGAAAPAAGRVPGLPRAQRGVHRAVLAAVRAGAPLARISRAWKRSSTYRGACRSCCTSRSRPPAATRGWPGYWTGSGSKGAVSYRTFTRPAELGQLVRDDLAEAAAPRPPSSPG
jgi:hypothetical protein